MPVVDGKTLVGWGAVRDVPWHFAGLFALREEAQLKAEQMGDGYVARYGERQETPDTFTSEEAQKVTAIPGSIFEPRSSEPRSPGDERSDRRAVARSISERIARLTARHRRLAFKTS